MKSYVRNTINLSCAKILLTSVIYNLKEVYTFFHPEMFPACILNNILWFEQQGHKYMYVRVPYIILSNECWKVGIFSSLRLKLHLLAVYGFFPPVVNL